MTAKRPAYLSALGIVSALGHGKEQISRNLFSGCTSGIIQRSDFLVCGSPIYVGQVSGELPQIPDHLSHYASRNFSLVISAVEEIRSDINFAIEKYGADRIAVVMGTSTSGISIGEAAVKTAIDTGCLPTDFDIRRQEIGSVAEALASYLNLKGPAYTVSVACSSGAQAIASGQRLLRTGIVDAVVAGGADSLCKLTVNGFHALSALSSDVCNPMSSNRDGTTIGEGAAIFLMDREEAEVALFGVGTSSDAHHMTAPETEGAGVEIAIRKALDDAGMAPLDMDYIQLHGTGTRQNDAVESKVVKRVFGEMVPCSSSKRQLGHTLGAAGAMGAAHCWLTASSENSKDVLPPHMWDNDPELGLLFKSLTSPGDTLLPGAKARFMSNAFAFGGNNSILIIGRS